MKVAVFVNVAGATATSAALLVAGHYASGWPVIVAIVAASAVLALTLNVWLRVRVREDQMRLRGVAVRAIRASEEERQALAHSLSDEAAQALAGALLHLKAARTEAGTAGSDRIGDARSVIVETMERLERNSAALAPSVLELLGPEAALVSLARSACERAGLRFHADAAWLGPLSKPARAAIVRITQDAIENAVEHANATEIRLATGHEDGMARVVVSDDGCGFDSRAVLRRPGGALGLSTMTELAAYWGGQVRIESRTGSGTRIEIRLPMVMTSIHA